LYSCLVNNRSNKLDKFLFYGPTPANLDAALPMFGFKIHRLFNQKSSLMMSTCSTTIPLLANRLASRFTRDFDFSLSIELDFVDVFDGSVVGCGSSRAPGITVASLSYYSWFVSISTH